MKWYVLQVATGKEIAVRTELIRKGYHAVVPLEDRLIRSGGEWKTKQYTLISSYVFVYCNFDAHTYYDIKEIANVQNWLGKPVIPLSYLDAEWIQVLGNHGEPLAPSEVAVVDNKPVVMSGILCTMASKITKIDKHARKATVALTVAGEEKTIQLSIKLAGDKDIDVDKDEDIETETTS